MLGAGKNTIVLMSNLALSETGLELADQIAQKTGARIFCDTFIARLPRGRGRPEIERLGYFAEQATEQLKDVEQLIMVGTKSTGGIFCLSGQTQ